MGAYGKQNADGHWCLMSTDGNCGPTHDNKVCPHDYCGYNGRCGPITDHPAVYEKFSNGHCETPAAAAAAKPKKARGRYYKFKCRMSDDAAVFDRFSLGVCKTWRRNRRNRNRGALLQKTRFMMNELAQISNMLQQEADA